MKPDLIAYAKERFKRLKKLLKATKKSGEQEIIHKIRVEIKKIKALLQCIHFYHEKFDDEKTFLPLRDIFRACNAIREPFVIARLAAQFGGQPAPSESADSELIQEFRSHLPQYLKNIRKVKKEILKHLQKVRAKEYKKYLSQRTSELKHELFPAFNQSELHKDRKRVKEIIYLSGITKAKKKTDPFLDKVSALIGKWHDKMVFIERLKESNAPDAVMIKTLQAECRSDLAELKTVINSYYA